VNSNVATAMCNIMFVGLLPEEGCIVTEENPYLAPLEAGNCEFKRRPDAWLWIWMGIGLTLVGAITLLVDLRAAGILPALY